MNYLFKFEKESITVVSATLLFGLIVLQFWKIGSLKQIFFAAYWFDVWIEDVQEPQNGANFCSFTWLKIYWATLIMTLLNVWYQKDISEKI